MKSYLDFCDTGFYLDYFLCAENTRVQNTLMLRHLTIHFPKSSGASEWVTEQLNERGRACEWSKRFGASEWVITTRLFVVLDQSVWSTNEFLSSVIFVTLYSTRLTDMPADVNVYFQISSYSRYGRTAKGEISFMMKTTKCSPGITHLYLVCFTSVPDFHYV